MTHVVKTRQQRLDGLVWKIGAIIVGYTLAVNLLLAFLPDSRGALIVITVAVPLMCVGLWFSVRNTFRTHYKKNKN